MAFEIYYWIITFYALWFIAHEGKTFYLPLTFPSCHFSWLYGSSSNIVRQYFLISGRKVHGRCFKIQLMCWHHKKQEKFLQQGSQIDLIVVGKAALKTSYFHWVNFIHKSIIKKWSHKWGKLPQNTPYFFKNRATRFGCHLHPSSGHIKSDENEFI
jgi:hypothetical protein